MRVQTLNTHVLYVSDETFCARLGFSVVHVWGAVFGVASCESTRDTNVRTRSPCLKRTHSMAREHILSTRDTNVRTRSPCLA